MTEISRFCRKPVINFQNILNLYVERQCEPPKQPFHYYCISTIFNRQKSFRSHPGNRHCKFRRIRSSSRQFRRNNHLDQSDSRYGVIFTQPALDNLKTNDVLVLKFTLLCLCKGWGNAQNKNANTYRSYKCNGLRWNPYLEQYHFLVKILPVCFVLKKGYYHLCE